MGAGGLARVELVRWMDQAEKVESSREPFMAPSRRGKCMDIGGRVKVERSITLGRPLQGACRCCVVNLTLKVSEAWKMAGLSPLSTEGNKEGCNCSECRGRSAGGLGKEVEEISLLGDGGDNPGERWFNLENS